MFSRARLRRIARGLLSVLAGMREIGSRGVGGWHDDNVRSAEVAAMYSAHDIANYFLCLCDEEAGDLLTNMKIQKLLYYAQGATLALTGAPLFSERVKAWEHGPVVPQVWQQYRGYGSAAIPKDESFDPDTIDVDTREILNEVYDVYGQFSAWKLRQMTHNEAPWVSTESNEEITNSRMKSYFETQLI